MSTQTATAAGGYQELRPTHRRLLQLLRASQLLLPFLFLFAGLAVTLVLAMATLPPVSESGRAYLSLAAALFTAVAFVLVALRLWRTLLDPLVRLEGSLARVCQGEPGASEALRDLGMLGAIARDIGSLNDELTDLYEDMDNRVARQTMRLAQKTASIKILYDVAAGINEAQSLDELLARFLRVLKEMVNGRAATVRLVMPDGSHRLVGAIGLDDRPQGIHEITPVELCHCGRALSAGDLLCLDDRRYCERIYGRRMFGADEMQVLSVPLEHRDELLGVYSVCVDSPGVGGREDIIELLFSIGHHLGVALAKHRSDEETRRLSIVEERNSLAHELHDSLAQTLASLRFQFRLLDESLFHAGIPEEARTDLGNIRAGLDEAHTELRSLLASFRAPMDRLGLVTALERITRRFGQRTGIHALFQSNCPPFETSPSTELQVTRIVQEALANIRKHASAHTVRLLLTRCAEGGYVLLVEDDGSGFQLPVEGEPEGEHVGLSIMQERARLIGALLHIESEPDEGTRIELRFSPEPVRPVPGTTGFLQCASC